MFRFLFYMLGIALLLSLLRTVIGVVAKFFVGSSTTAAGRQTRPPGPPRVPSGGTLRQDPVCGAFVSESIAIRQGSGGDALYFCSEECRKKHAAGG
jgi:YHS domain-containing protein